MDDVLSGADIDIYGLADATRRRANGLGEASRADSALLSRTDLSTAVRARPDLKARATFAEPRMQKGEKIVLKLSQRLRRQSVIWAVGGSSGGLRPILIDAHSGSLLEKLTE